MWTLLLTLGVLCTLRIQGLGAQVQQEGPGVEKRLRRDLQEHWELAFGPKADLFASAVTLDLAIDDVAAGADRLASSLGPSRLEALRKFGKSLGDLEHVSYARQLGCLPYSTGMKLLRHQTEVGVAPSLRAVPFVVNKARNAICFHFTKIQTEFKEKFLFHYEIPIALTIDKQLYKVVDEMYFQNATLQQALGASPVNRNVFLVVYPYR